MSGAVRIINVVGRCGGVLSTRFQATLEGGPELAAALARLDDAVRVRASKEALLAAGGVLATKWRSRVPILDAHYQHALDAATRAAKTKAGAAGSVAPREVAGVADDEQPTRCRRARARWSGAPGSSRPRSWRTAAGPVRSTCATCAPSSWRRRCARRTTPGSWLALGHRSVAACQAAVSSLEFTEWMASARLEPFASEADDHRMAQLLALVANINRDPQRRRRPYTPDDFLPRRSPRAELGQDGLRSCIDTAMVAFGGIRRRG